MGRKIVEKREKLNGKAECTVSEIWEKTRW